MTDAYLGTDTGKVYAYNVDNSTWMMHEATTQLRASRRSTLSGQNFICETPASGEVTQCPESNTAS